MPCILCWMLHAPLCELATLQKSVTLTKEKHVPSVVWQSTHIKLFKYFSLVKKSSNTYKFDCFVWTKLFMFSTTPTFCDYMVWCSTWSTTACIQFDSSITPTSCNYSVWFLHHKTFCNYTIWFVPHHNSWIVQFDFFTIPTFCLIQFESSTTPFCDHSIWFFHHTNILKFDSFITSLIHHTNIL